MRKIILFIGLTTLIFSSPFNNTTENNDKVENDRLCKIFTKKVADYEKDNRGDALANRTLDSYKERKDKYCKN